MRYAVATLAIVVWAVFWLLLVAVGTARSESTGVDPDVRVAADIGAVFGPRYAREAVAVSWCESRLQTSARNGQYRGTFQMGASERRLYGHGSTALAQARAARRYFVASGRDWSPWTCRWAAR